MCRKLSIMCLVLVLSSAAYAGDVLIGSWEGVSDGWTDWNGGTQISIEDATVMPSKYQYSYAWSSDGYSSLRLEKQGWQQNLTISLAGLGLVDEFLANNIFQFDVMAEADTLGVGGWSEIYTCSLNANGIESNIWQDLGEKPAAHWDYWAGSPQRVFTVQFDYSAYKSQIAPTASWVEFILATNGGDTDRDVFYIDNARLTPEPTTVTLLGLGALALLRRKR